MTEDEVRKLLRKIKDDDSERAFHRFFDLTYDRLFRIAFYYSKREEWSQEIVLDVFMTLWNQRERLTNIKSIEDYCFIITKNAALNYLAKESKYSDNEADIDMATTESSDTSASPEEIAIGDELFAVYVKALDRLPLHCRRVYLCIEEDKKSYAETAEELGISVNTVDTQLRRAKQLLREAICKFYEK